MNPKNLNILHPHSEEEWNKYFRLRYEILRKPWNQPESSTKDDAEDRSVHWLITDQNGKAVGAGRLQINSDTEGQIRSMAVDNTFQSKGIGSLLIQEIEKEALKRKLKKIVLDAREEAVNFYLKNGYKVIGDSYLLFGVIRHFKMQKSI